MHKSREIKTSLIKRLTRPFLFLDIDTLVLRDLSLLVGLPGEFLIAPDSNQRKRRIRDKPELEEWFRLRGWPVADMVAVNSGVWIARKADSVDRLGELWPKLWREGITDNPMDQPSLWTAVVQSNVDLNLIPDRYNALVLRDPKLMRTAHVAHFIRSLALGGSLLDDAVESYRATGVYPRQLIQAAIRRSDPWRQNAEPWMYWKSGHFTKAAIEKGRRMLRLRANAIT
ncbi:hypothetical protein [Roseiconus lacunae]|uniref:hypothetical protein n=1 Tax=Roseiconus lacunae TaxID=2605694 RepID=UPI0011F130EA|nr:hypothetical protein [Roseiconus lacunae]